MNKFFVIVLFSQCLFSDWLLTVSFPLNNGTSDYCIKENSVIAGSSKTTYIMRNMSNGEFITYSWDNTKNPQTVTQGNYYFDMTLKKCLKSSISEPEPTNPDNGSGNGSNPTNPITPDENGLIMGMKESDFHFSMAIWGVALSFLMSIGLIISF
ncbi:hypothetical protein [Aliarcobacter butzleri]|uniref:hypothetical protein n=1 Tax=Aliarcobacter butzleri TaxID=28197 RepID=UPI002B24A5C1|nr:hypothetical protein [Aliarcobacter butzleri]